MQFAKEGSHKLNKARGRRCWHFDHERNHPNFPDLFFGANEDLYREGEPWAPRFRTLDFRIIDGSNNNLANSTMNQADTDFARVGPAHLADGFMK